jgi:DNA-binding response OmpR family regulator
MRLAVLSYEPSELDTVCSILNSAGHATLAYSGGKELMLQLKRDMADMLILDWQVADTAAVGAAEIMVWLREKLQSTMPVLFLTGRSGEDAIVEGLAAGANDYLIKPIRRSELVARVQALLRRAYPNQHMPENLEFGQYVFETRTARLSRAGNPIDLTQKEFDLALLLFRNLGRPLSRAYILEAVWSRESDIPSRTLDTHISRVRNKLQLRPENGLRLAPVYSYGYRLEAVTGE